MYFIGESSPLETIRKDDERHRPGSDTALQDVCNIEQVSLTGDYASSILG
jgi:hypothetical protein